MATFSPPCPTKTINYGLASARALGHGIKYSCEDCDFCIYKEIIPQDEPKQKAYYCALHKVGLQSLQICPHFTKECQRSVFVLVTRKVCLLDKVHKQTVILRSYTYVIERDDISKAYNYFSSIGIS